MSAQRLNDRSLRRIARVIGEDVLRGWSNGGYIFDFVTPDHRHGWIDKKSGEWGWQQGRLCHYSSCASTDWVQR